MRLPPPVLFWNTRDCWLKKIYAETNKLWQITTQAVVARNATSDSTSWKMSFQRTVSLQLKRHRLTLLYWCQNLFVPHFHLLKHFPSMHQLPNAQPEEVAGRFALWVAENKAHRLRRETYYSARSFHVPPVSHSCHGSTLKCKLLLW